MKNKVIYVVLATIIIGTFLYKHDSSPISKLIFNDVDESISLEDRYFYKWKDKSWLTLGDSITRANGYQSRVKVMLGFSRVDNRGVNGQTMAHQSKNKSTYEVGQTIDYGKYDLVTIFTGTNDFRYNKRLGNVQVVGSSGFDENTFTGSYQLLIEHILSSNPKIDLVLITPPQRVHDGYDVNFTNKVGSKLIYYVNTIKVLGQMYSIPVLDLYSESGITKETMDVFTRDGLHPNETGYERISEKMYRFLLGI